MEGMRRHTGSDEPAISGSRGHGWSRPFRAPFPSPGKVLVAKDRHALPTGLEDLDNLAKEIVARPQVLALLVPGIVPVFGDQEDAVNGQLTAPLRQGLGDRR